MSDDIDKKKIVNDLFDNDDDDEDAVPHHVGQSNDVVNFDFMKENAHINNQNNNFNVENNDFIKSNDNKDFGFDFSNNNNIHNQENVGLKFNNEDNIQNNNINDQENNNVNAQRNKNDILDSLFGSKNIEIKQNNNLNQNNILYNENVNQDNKMNVQSNIGNIQNKNVHNDKNNSFELYFNQNNNNNIQNNNNEIQNNNNNNVQNINNDIQNNNNNNIQNINNDIQNNNNNNVQNIDNEGNIKNFKFNNTNNSNFDLFDFSKKNINSQNSNFQNNQNINKQNNDNHNNNIEMNNNLNIENNDNKHFQNDINNVVEKNKQIDFDNIIGKIQFTEENQNPINNHNENIKNQYPEVNPLDDFDLFQNTQEKKNNNNKNNDIPLNNNNLNNFQNNNNIISNQNNIPQYQNNQNLDFQNFENDFKVDFENDFNDGNFISNKPQNNKNINDYINNNRKNENLQNYQVIDIYKLDKIDKPHNLNELNEELNENKKDNFIKDLFYSLLKISKLNDINSLKPPSKLEEEILTFQVNDELNEIQKNDENIIDQIKESLIKYDDSDYYIKSFIYNISPCYKSIYKNIWNEIAFFRNAKNDGDSYFRCFMFSYLEKIILFRNILELKQIIYFISSEIMKPFKERNPEIKKNEVLVILGIILSNVQKEDINSAILTLNRAFSSNDNFCQTIIKYMKVKLEKFIQENHNLFNIGELISNDIIPKKYFDKNLTTFNYLFYLEQKVKMMQTDPDYFIFLITPLTFNVNLKLYVNEGFNKTQLIHDNSPFQNGLCIELIYSQQKYQIAYTYSLYNTYKNDLLYEVVDFLENDKDCIQLFCDEIVCEQCKKQSMEITLDRIKKEFPICNNCLIENINKVITNRIKNIIKDNFNYPEYYLRDIELTDSNKNNYLKLSNPEFKYLFGESSTIKSQLIYLMINSCLLCGNVYESKDEFINLICGCRLCKNCIGETIMKDTSDLIILCNFEKKKSRKKPSLCACGNPFEVDNAILLLYNNDEIENYKTKANQRLKDYCLKYCMRCLHSDKKRNNKGSYINVEIIKDNEIKDFNCTQEKHILCRNCFKELTNLIKSKIKQGEIDKESENFFVDCNICNNKHLIKIPKKLKNIINSEEENEEFNEEDFNEGIKRKKKDKDDNACCNVF